LIASGSRHAIFHVENLRGRPCCRLIHTRIGRFASFYSVASAKQRRQGASVLKCSHSGELRVRGFAQQSADRTLSLQWRPVSALLRKAANKRHSVMRPPCRLIRTRIGRFASFYSIASAKQMRQGARGSASTRSPPKARVGRCRQPCLWPRPARTHGGTSKIFACRSFLERRGPHRARPRLRQEVELLACGRRFVREGREDCAGCNVRHNSRAAKRTFNVRERQSVAGLPLARRAQGHNFVGVPESLHGRARARPRTPNSRIFPWQARLRPVISGLERSRRSPDDRRALSSVERVEVRRLSIPGIRSASSRGLENSWTVLSGKRERR